MARAGYKWLFLGLLALCPVLLASCMRTRTYNHLAPHPVTIRVTWKGEPVRYAIVNLEPGDHGEAQADGCTDENGVFEPRSFANDGTKDGLIYGKYNVVLESYDPTRAVALRLPPGAKPTEIPGTEWDTGVTLEFREGDSQLEINIP